MKKTLASTITLASILMSLVLVSASSTYFIATSSYTVISNVFEGTSNVSRNLPLTISPDGGGIPKLSTVGVPQLLYLDFENPNTVSVNGRLVITFSRNGTKADDVYVSDPYHGLSVINEGVNGSELVFLIEVGGASPYLRFDPGIRFNQTCLSIQFNTAGFYKYSIAVIQ
jgi:hypothetical protein